MRKRTAGEGMMAVSLIASRMKKGSLDGVEIDLDHPELGPDWVPVSQQASEYGYLQEGVIFPSEQHQSLDELRKGEGLPASFFLIYANAGDRLAVADVVPEISGKSYDHQDDRASRLAYLNLIRGSGEIVSIPRPMRFVRGARLRGGHSLYAFDNVCVRLEELAGVESAGDAERSAWSAASSAQILLKRLLEDCAGAAEEALLLVLVNLSAQAGYHLGRLEVLDLEVRRDRQIVGARESGQARTAPDLLRAARKMSADTGWSRTKMAKALEGEWGTPPRFKSQRSIQTTLNKYGIGPAPRTGKQG